jgi:uncharacterized protein YycO
MKEYDAIISEKAVLNGQIANTKELIVNERSQIKAAENSLAEINKTLNNDKKALQELHTAVKKKNESN